MKDVSKYEIPAIRPYDFGLNEFEFGECILKQKVGKWETFGNKEIWQVRLPAGYELSWGAMNPFWNLYVVYSGAVEVTIDTGERFTAKERDILHIPSRVAAQIVTTENTVLLDYNCQGHLLRALAELKSLEVGQPGTIGNADIIDRLLSQNDCHVRCRKL